MKHQMNTFGGDTPDDVTDWGQESVEQREWELDAAIAAARTTPDETLDAILALLGLIKSIVDRPDCPDEIARAALSDPRYRAAREVAKAYL